MRENCLKINEETLIYILDICEIENVLMVSIDKQNKNIRVSTLNYWKENIKPSVLIIDVLRIKHSTALWENSFVTITKYQESWTLGV